MTLPPNDRFCHAKRGLLILRNCGKLALSSCQSCGTGLCEDHQFLTQYGVFCPDCAARDERFNDIEDERLERSRFRLFGGYYGDGYYYTFTDTDYGTFDAQAGKGDESAQAEGALATAMEGDDEDSDDLDSFDES